MNLPGAPVRYDFPGRVSDIGAAERELRRLERSMTVAYHRGDKFALDYLDRRYKRASRALAALRWHAQQADTGQRPEPSPAPLAAPAAAGANERTTP